MPVVFAMSPEPAKPSESNQSGANNTPLEGQALVASILAKQSTQNSKSLNIFKKQGGARKSEDGDEKKVVVDNDVAEKSRKSTS